MLLKVLHVKPCEQPVVVEIKRDDLDAMQKLIGDDDPMLQRVRLDESNHLGMYMDDDGISKELLPNRKIPSGDTVFGPFFIMRDGELDKDEVSLTEADIEKYSKLFAL